MATLYKELEQTYNKMINLQNRLMGESVITRYISEHKHFPSFNDLIQIEEVASDFIKSLRKIDFDVDVIISDFNADEDIMRFRHIAIVYILGFVLAPFDNLWMIERKKYHNNLDFDDIWYFTALFHDYGYHVQKGISNTNKQRDLVQDCMLFNSKNKEDIDYTFKTHGYNDEKFIVYSCDEIKNYFDYSIELHSKDEKDKKPLEVVDHGIIGGVKIFESYFQKASECSFLPSLSITEAVKIACYASVQHNIFKSSSIEEDDTYKKYKLQRLFKTEPALVTRKNKMILLLSLVDTFEIAKRIVKDEMIIKTTEILESIEISVESNSITINMKKCFDKFNGELDIEQHLKSLANLCNWTELITEYRKEDKTVIITV